MFYRLETTRRLEVAEMKICRWGCGVIRIDRVRNEDIRERMGVTNTGARCKKARLRWFGHVKRREESFVGRRMLSVVPPGRRRWGSLKQRWIDNINADIRSVGVRQEDTQESEIWKAYTSAAATSY